MRKHFSFFGRLENKVIQEGMGGLYQTKIALPLLTGNTANLKDSIYAHFANHSSAEIRRAYGDRAVENDISGPRG